MKALEKPITFLKEVKAELGKVSWSTRRELMGSTVVVIVITAILAVSIFAMDALLARVLAALFSVS